MIEKMLMDFLTFLISNADKISAAIGIIIVVLILAYLVNEIGKRTEAQSKRDDIFKTQLLDLHTKTAGNNERIVTLLEVHEKAALERYQVQDLRDRDRLAFLRQQTEAMTKITDNLSIISETKVAIDTIQATQAHTEVLVTQVGTDVKDTVQQAAARNLEGYKDTIRENYELILGAVDNVHTVLGEIKKDMIAQQGQHNTDVITKLHFIGEALATLTTVAEKSYGILATPTQPLLVTPVTVEPANTEDDVA